jgi:hypothetical protein
MEERAKQRAQKRQELAQLYEEKKKLQELHEQEEQKRREAEAVQKANQEKEKKRMAKLEELRAKEEAKLEKEREQQKMEDARDYYRQRLLEKYIWKTFLFLAEQRLRKVECADRQRRTSLQRQLLRKLKHAAAIQVFHRNQEMDKLTRVAENFEEFNLQTKVLRILKTHARDEAAVCRIYKKQVRDRFLVARVFATWVKLHQFLRAENQIIADTQHRIVTKFRKIKLGRKVLEALSDNAETEKINQ